MVGKFAACARDLADDAVEFLFKPRLFLFQIDEFAERDKDLPRFADARDDLLPRLRAACNEADLACTRKAENGVLVQADEPARLGRKEHVYFARRRAVDLHLHGAHRLDQVDNALKRLRLLLIRKAGVVAGIIRRDDETVVARQVGINLLRDERDERMQQAERVFKNEQKHAERAALLFRVLAVQSGFGKLDVPIAEIVPHKIGELVRRDAEIELPQSAVHFADARLQTGDDPAVGGLQLDFRERRNLIVLHVHEHETRGVPNLIDEVARSLYLRIGKARIVPRRNARAICSSFCPARRAPSRE